MTTIATTLPMLSPMAQDVATDAQLIDLWLHGRPETTRSSYQIAVARFCAFVEKPLRAVTLLDLQRFMDSLTGLSPASRAARLSAVKSLLGFAHKLGYLPFDVGRAVRLPKVKDTLAERILSEDDVDRLISAEPDPRNRVLLALLYLGGLRVSEATGLRWRDVQQRGDSVQLTVFGKGGKTRAVLLPPDASAVLLWLGSGVQPDTPVFQGRNGAALSAHHIWFIVKEAAVRAGLPKDTSPHWLRHAHCSHALDHGAPLHLIAATVGHSNIATTGRYLHARPNDSSARFLKTPTLAGPPAGPGKGR